MRFYQQMELKSGEIITLRNLEKSDAGAAIFCLRKVSGETDFLLREAKECGMTLAQEEEFIEHKTEHPREMLLGVFAGEELIGMAGLNGVSPMSRARHRASIGISLLKVHWGKGIGTAMMHALIDAAKSAGYEQLELDVVDKNTRAQALYAHLGFETVGRLPRGLRYMDGTYAELIFMVLRL